MGCDIHLKLVYKPPSARRPYVLWDFTNDVRYFLMSEWPSIYSQSAQREAKPKRYTRARGKSAHYLTRRDYDRFARLSGVRGDGPRPNDWPDWARSEFHDDYADGDFHSHTHYPLLEAIPLFLGPVETMAGEDRGSDWLAVVRVNPLAMLFPHIDFERFRPEHCWLLICYDN